MSKVNRDTTIKEYQGFVKEVYGVPNDRYFSVWDMITNVERFMMRGLKGIRKNDAQKIKINLLIGLSWFMSIMNQLHVDIEKNIWERFPYQCSYCASSPCSCKEKKVEIRQKLTVDESRRPKTLDDFQNMFEKIYPAGNRTLDHAGVHLAEEAGEFSEAILAYRGGHVDEDFRRVELEAADFFSCIMGVFNSLGVSTAEELALMFSNNCHVCHNAPCTCNFRDITEFKS